MNQRHTEDSFHGEALPLLSLEEPAYARSATTETDPSFMLLIPSHHPSPGISTMLSSAAMTSYSSSTIFDSTHSGAPAYRIITPRASQSSNHTLKIALIAGITTPVSLFILWVIVLKLYRIRYKKKHMFNDSDIENQPMEASQDDSNLASSSVVSIPEETLSSSRPSAGTQETTTDDISGRQRPRSTAEHFDIALDLHRASLLKESLSPPVIPSVSSRLALYANPYAHPALTPQVASTSGTTIPRGPTPTSLLTGSPRSSFISTPGTIPSKLPPFPNWKPPVPAPEGTEALVVIEFTPTIHDELAVVPGEKVKVIAEYDDGWILCTKPDTGRQGVVPFECLDPTSFDNIRSASPGTGTLHQK